MVDIEWLLRTIDQQTEEIDYSKEYINIIRKELKRRIEEDKQIKLGINKIRKYIDSDGSESEDLLEDAIEIIENTFKQGE